MNFYPKISIIIPTYNAQKTLQRCLKSIVIQSLKDIEVLIIDGGSTDTTIEIIKEFESNYNCIKFISESDNGIYDAMNKGIKLANGDWLYFLGSDDTLFDSSVLSKIDECINKSNSKVIYGNVLMRGKNQWNLDNTVFNGKCDLEKMIQTNICHQAIFYHKSIFVNYGNYDLKYISSADQDFNLRCYSKTPFEYLNIIVANFFVGGHSSIVDDVKFNQDRGALLYWYFRSNIFTKSFINSRLYIQRAAFSRHSPLSILERAYCVIAYLYLKASSVVN